MGTKYVSEEISEKLKKELQFYESTFMATMAEN